MKSLITLFCILGLFSEQMALAGKSRKPSSTSPVFEAIVTSGEKISDFQLIKVDSTVTLNFSDNRGIHKSVTVSDKNYEALLKEAKGIEGSAKPYDIGRCNRNSIVLNQPKGESMQSAGACIGAQTATRHKLVSFVNLLNTLI